MKSIFLAVVAAFVSVATPATAQTQSPVCNVDTWHSFAKEEAAANYPNMQTAAQFALQLSNFAVEGREEHFDIPQVCKQQFLNEIAIRNGWNNETRWEVVDNMIHLPLKMSKLRSTPTPAVDTSSVPSQEVTQAADRAEATAQAAQAAERRVEALETQDEKLANMPQNLRVKVVRDSLAAEIAQAKEAAKEAQAAAAAAEKSASAAKRSAGQAIAARNQAEIFAQNAQQAAEAAKDSATAAGTAATNAATSEENAAKSATRAQEAAEKAEAATLPQWMKDWLGWILGAIALLLAVLFGLLFNTRKRVKKVEDGVETIGGDYVGQDQFEEGLANVAKNADQNNRHT